LTRGAGEAGSPERLKRMKIAFVVEFFPNKDELSGGVRVSVKRQAEALSSNHEVIVVACRTIFPGLSRYSAMAREQGARQRFRTSEGSLRIYRPACVHVPLVWKLTGPFQLMMWTIVVCAFMEKRISLIHAHRCFPAGLAACFAAGVLRVPFVLTTYGSDVSQGLRRDVAGYWISSASRLALSRADAVIAVSKALGDKITSFGVRPKKTRVVPSGVELLLSGATNREEARRRLGLPLDARIVLFAANLVPVKDPVTMVRAFLILREAMTNALLVILGTGELEEAVREEVRKESASGFILLKGRRPRDEIPFWLAACDVVALSSIDEGCPVIALEGFVSGKPFVGTAVGGIPEIVPSEDFGLLSEAGNPSSLAGRLALALEKRWDKEVLVKHGRSFSWENQSSQISRVYDEVLEEKARHGAGSKIR